MNLVACQMDIQMLWRYSQKFKASFLIPKGNRISISCICRWFISARRNIRRMFAKHYRNCQVVTISWVYYPPRKICAKTHTKINIFRICLEFQNYDAKKEKIIKLGERIINRQYITIRELAQLIGNVVARFVTVLTGPLYYRDMER